MTPKVQAVSLIVLCQVASMSLWFSASAIVPNLIASGQISGQQASLLTGAVQLGFVTGTLISASLGLADRLDPRRFFALSALVGSAANAVLLFTGFDDWASLAFRFLTGVSMAGIYPVGMKMAAGWAERNMGLMIGLLVGALTLGSALPHLFSSLTSVDWRLTLGAASVCALAGAVLIGLVQLGPRHSTSPRFVASAVVSMLRKPAILLANAGYFGHMWELYAMWAWVGAFLAWAATTPGMKESALLGNAPLMTFFVVAAGAIGCLVAGAVADRIGRTTVTIAAMATSGACAATIGLWAHVGPVALVLVALLWGLTVVADSAQFSASIVELSDPALVGTALTVQTSIGFLLTFFSIQLMPIAIDTLTWRYAFSVLAIGPFLGVLAMWCLRRSPESIRLANGRR